MLNLDPVTIIFQVVNFIILALVINRFIFRPVLRGAAERREEKERLLRELAEERRHAASLREELEARQAQFEEEAQRIIVSAEERATAERQEMLQQARSEAEKLLVEAHAEAHLLQRQAMNEFHDKLLDAMVQICGQMIGQVAPQEVHDHLVSRLSERIREMGQAEMSRVEAMRRSLGTREATAYVWSARELSSEQRGQLARILIALADRHVNLELTTDPALVAGLRVRLGDTMMDSSIAGQLAELRDQASAALEEQVGRA